MELVLTDRGQRYLDGLKEADVLLNDASDTARGDYIILRYISNNEMVDPEEFLRRVPRFAEASRSIIRGLFEEGYIEEDR